jgi:hypothetical protein
VKSRILLSATDASYMTRSMALSCSSLPSQSRARWRASYALMVVEGDGERSTVSMK